ncbi:MAG: exodeoxyribonuclease I [Patescibacteria group bacterium]
MTFYFYDLETSGVSPAISRVMQFAGQRTDQDLNPIGEPDNVLVRLDEDIIPDPFAVLTHRITPQMTKADGITEREFIAWFHSEVATEKTVMVGYNNIRFDDEFMRFTSYRNFHDPYEWHWKDGRGRWDLLDVMRMTRALRPDGIEWPFTSEGKPTVALEKMTAVNNIEHTEAHRADSDVYATIEMARLLKKTQPKLFEYLHSMREKNAVLRLVEQGEPFVYTSGRYVSEHEKTTVVTSIGYHPEIKGSLLVYDLRQDPEDFSDLSAEKLSERIFVPRGSDLQRLPVKTLAANKCPAVAPLSVLDDRSQERLAIDMGVIEANLKKLKNSDLTDRIREAFSIRFTAQQPPMLTDIQAVDGLLYSGGFMTDRDKSLMAKVRSSDDLLETTYDFADSRLDPLLELYTYRNYHTELTSAQIDAWESYRKTKFTSGGDNSELAAFSAQFQKASELAASDKEKQYLLEELKLYVESIMPEDI